MRGRIIHVIADDVESIAYLQDTFYPDGTFGTTFADAVVDHPPNFVLQDRTLKPSDLRVFWAWAADQGTLGHFEITRQTWRNRLSLGAIEVFWLQGHPDPTQLLVREGNTFNLLGVPSRDRKRWLTRLLRDFGTRFALSDGSLVLHSSAFQLNGRAYLAIGDSGSGKTTVSVAVPRVLQRGCWIGNDRIHLDQLAGEYNVSACPLSLATNKGTLEILGLNDYREWNLHDAVPDDSTDWAEYNGEIKLKLSPREVEQHFGVRVAPSAPLGGIILPQVDFARSLSLSRISASAARPVIIRNCLSINDNMYGEDWLALQHSWPNAARLLDQFLASLERIPLFQCVTSRQSDVVPLVQALADTLESRR
jgi:hypothetical protein